MKPAFYQAFLTAAAMSAIAAAFITGCGKTGGSGTEGTKTVKVWAMGAEGELLDQMTAGFEAANPGYTVDIQALPWDQAHDKLLTAVAAKSGPDVIQMGTSWMAEFADAGSLADMTDETDKYPSLKQTNFFDSSLLTSIYKGKYVGIPWYIDTRVLFYRTDLLADAGYPKGPVNWDQLKAAAAKLAKPGEKKYGILLDPKDGIVSELFAWQNGADPLSPDLQPQFNLPSYVEATKYLMSFFREGLSPAQNDYELFQGFEDGTFPMFISGPWMVDSIHKNCPELTGKWAVRILPGKVSNTSLVGGSNLTLFSYSKNKEAGLRYINYLSDEDTQLKWFQVSNSLPSRKDAWQTGGLKSDPILSVFGEQMKDAKPAPIIPQWEAVSQIVQTAMEAMAVNGDDVQKTMDEVNVKAKNALSQ